MSSRLGESMTKLQAEMDKVEPKRLTPPPIVICYVLSVPTSTNRLFTGTGKGKRKTADYTDWIATAGGEILAQRPKMPIKALPSGPYAVTVEIPETDPGDIDNRMKAVLNLLVRMQITPDDRWLWVQGSRRSRTIPSGQIRVVILPAHADRPLHAPHEAAGRRASPCAGGSIVPAGKGDPHASQDALLGVLAEHGAQFPRTTIDAPSFFLLPVCGRPYRCQGQTKRRLLAKVCAMSRHWFRSAPA